MQRDTKVWFTHRKKNSWQKLWQKKFSYFKYIQRTETMYNELKESIRNVFHQTESISWVRNHKKELNRNSRFGNNNQNEKTT